jgi:hypothetical protein
VSACGGQEKIRIAYPPAADLVDEQKPEITAAVLESDVAAAEYDSAVEAWGERGWSAVGRVCRWAKAHGMKIECKPE